MMEDTVDLSGDGALEFEWLAESEVCNRTVVGKLLARKFINRNVMKYMLLKGWNLKNDVNIREVENNIFIFSFDSMDDCYRVMRDRPWLITGALLIMQEWNTMLTLEDLRWNLCPFWIQLHGVPLGGMTCKNVVVMGGKVGKVLEYEKPIVNGMVMREFLRVKVMVDISVPLVEGFWISGPKSKKLWIRVRYEKLQDFCYKCGIVDHDFRDCVKERVMSIFSPDKPMYGSWMGVPLAKYRRDGEIVEVEAMESEREDISVLRNNAVRSEERIVKEVLVEKMEVETSSCVEKVLCETEKCIVTSGEVDGVDLSDLPLMSTETVIGNSFEVGESSGSSSLMFEDAGSNDVCQLKSMIRDKRQIDAVQKQIILAGDERKWHDDGYFVEFPSDDEEKASVVVNDSEVQVLLSEQLNKVSLKRSYEEEMEANSLKKLKSESSPLFSGVFFKLGKVEECRKVKRGKEMAVKIFNKSNACDFVEAPVQCAKIEYLEGEVFCFKTVVVDGMNADMASGWPSATGSS